jgi:predicted transcriptional regulator
VKELKTVSVCFRVSPRLKRALQIAAASVNRTQTNFLETLLFEYYDTHGIKVELKLNRRRGAAQ